MSKILGSLGIIAFLVILVFLLVVSLERQEREKYICDISFVSNSKSYEYTSIPRVTIFEFGGGIEFKDGDNKVEFEKVNNIAKNCKEIAK